MAKRKIPAFGVNGNSADFNPRRLKRGMFATTRDTRKAYAAFNDGDVKELTLQEDFIDLQEEVAELKTLLDEVEDNANNALEVASSAIHHAEQSADGVYLTTYNAFHEEVDSNLGPFNGGTGGGGGGGEWSGGGSEIVSNSVVSISGTSGSNSKKIATGVELDLSFTWSSLENGEETGNGEVDMYVGSSIRYHSDDIAQGSVTIRNVHKMLGNGKNSIRIVVTDIYGKKGEIRYTVIVVGVSNSWLFDPSTPVHGAFTLYVTPNGNADKVLHTAVDGVELETVATSVSGSRVGIPVPAQTHGTHVIESWFDADIDGTVVESNHLRAEFMSDAGESTPIISTQFNQQTARQFESLGIAFYVYDPDNPAPSVTLSVNGETVNTITVDRQEQLWAYQIMDMGELVLTITCGETSRSFSFDVEESSIPISAVEDSLILALDARGRSNGEEAVARNRWTYGNVSASMTGFNFVTNGWMADSRNRSLLRINGGARVTIPVKLFASDIRGTGATISFDFATSRVRNYDTPIITCWSGDSNGRNYRGYRITAQEILLQSEQSSVFTQFNEGEKVRVDFVIGKISEYRLMYIYINGVISQIVRYPTNDDFEQMNPVGITIGSDDSTVDIYGIRIYQTDLTMRQVFSNLIADEQDVDRMVELYRRNDIFDDYGNILASKLPTDLPYEVFDYTGTHLPQEKGDKVTISGEYVDKENPGSSYTYEGAQDDVQGTSSQYYPRKNYKLKMKGRITRNGVQITGVELYPGDMPITEFCFKKDFASSEGANNVILANLYNDTCPYKTPAQRENPKVRQGIKGRPIALFGTSDGGVHQTFLGKYNKNFDKGTYKLFGFSSPDESIEFKNNASQRVLFMSKDFSSLKADGTPAYLDDFEWSYPEDLNDPSQIEELFAFFYDHDPDRATNEAIEPVTYGDVTYTSDTAEYRLAAFKALAPEYIEVTAWLFFYLFTEVFLMVDNRAKNLFISFVGSDVTGEGRAMKKKAIPRPYDFDTAIGINNEGRLVFGYALEDTDVLSVDANGKQTLVYNGQLSRAWNMIRLAYPTELAAMWQQLRHDGVLTCDGVIQLFDEHQAHWPVMLVNQDTWNCYVLPYIENRDDYLEMAQGLKQEQRNWWLHNRFPYIDSKYVAGDSLAKYLDFRGYAKSSFRVTPYADIYTSVKFGSYTVQRRASRNTEYVIECPVDDINDTEIQIFSADKIKSFGDASGFLVGRCNISMGTMLEDCIVGRESSGYINPNLTSLTFGNNIMLRRVVAARCVNLTGNIDMEGCEDLQSVNFIDTRISGLTLPNGGILESIALPGGVSNITIKNQPGITTFRVGNVVDTEAGENGVVMAKITNGVLAYTEDNPYSGVTTLNLENVSDAIPVMDILAQMPDSSRLRLSGFYWEMANVGEIRTFYSVLDRFRGTNEDSSINYAHAWISAHIHIPSVHGNELLELEQREIKYPYITITATTSDAYLTLYNGETQLERQTVYNGGDGTPWSGATPTKAADVQYTYTFAGFNKNASATAGDPDYYKAVTADRDVYAVFSKTLRSYEIKFVNNDGSTIATQNVAYGNMPTAPSVTPTHVGGTASDYQFTGWGTLTAVTGPKTYTAQYKYAGLEETITDSWETFLGKIDDGTAASTYGVKGTKLLDLGSYGTMLVGIAGFNKDALPGGGKADVTMFCEYLLPDSRAMGSSTSGYPQPLETWLVNNIQPILEAQFGGHLKAVAKNFPRNDKTYTDSVKVWMASYNEVYGSSDQTGQPAYSAYFGSNDRRIRKKVGGSSAVWWWLRSYYASYYFYSVSPSGSDYSCNPSSSGGVAFGFCLGKL